jgi:hypothetical protein
MKGMGEGACIGEGTILIDVFIYDLLEIDHWREAFLGGVGVVIEDLR